MLAVSVLETNPDPMDPLLVGLLDPNPVPDPDPNHYYFSKDLKNFRKKFNNWKIQELTISLHIFSMAKELYRFRIRNTAYHPGFH
jgi:hypothetical protein